jgi:hypothetical protein
MVDVGCRFGGLGGWMEVDKNDQHFAAIKRLCSNDWIMNKL